MKMKAIKDCTLQVSLVPESDGSFWRWTITNCEELGFCNYELYSYKFRKKSTAKANFIKFAVLNKLINYEFV